MTQYKPVVDGQPISGGAITAVFNNLMAFLSLFGKGVPPNAIPVTPRGPGAVTIGTGCFLAQTLDRIAVDYDFPVGSNASGYLWIQADDDPGNSPRTMLTASADDPGSLWVCLGHVSSDGAGEVTVTDDGRQYFGSSVFHSSYVPVIQQTVADHYQEAIVPQVQSMVADAVPVDRTEYLTGDGTRSSFPLGYAPRLGSIVLQMSGPRINFRVSGKVLTFDSAPSGPIQINYRWVQADQ